MNVRPLIVFHLIHPPLNGIISVLILKSFVERWLHQTIYVFHTVNTCTYYIHNYTILIVKYLYSFIFKVCCVSSCFE